MVNFKGNILLPLKPTLILILGYFFYSLFPLLPSISYNFHNGQRIAQIILLTTSAILLVNRSELYLPIKKILYCFLAFIILSFTSSAISNYPYSSMMNTMHYVMLAIFSISLLNTKVSKKFYIALFTIHSSLIFVCVLNIIFSLVEQQPIIGHNIIMKFDNIRHFNHIQVLSIPLGLYILNTTKYKAITVTSITSNLVILFISNSLAAFVCLFLIFILLLILKLKEHLKNFTFTFVISIFIFSLIKFFEVNYISYDPIISDSGRIEMWLNSIYQSKEFILGIGPGNYSIVLQATALSHPHNFVIQLLNENGIFATLIAFYIIYLVFKKIELTTDYKKLLVLTLLTSLIYSLFSGLFVMPLTQIIFCFLFSNVIKANEKITFSSFLKVITISFSLVYFVISMISASKLDGDTPKMAGPSFWSAGEKNLDGL